MTAYVQESILQRNFRLKLLTLFCKLDHFVQLEKLWTIQK